MRFHALMLVAALTVLGAAAMPVSSFAADAALTAAVASSSRPAGDRARDGARHPGASLAFWGLKPGQTVIEIAPGGGYWSEILAPYASKTHGHYIAAMGKEGQKLPARFADTKTYGDVKYTVFSNSSGPLGPAGTVVRGHEFHYATLVLPGPDASFADLADAQGCELGAAGGRRGHISGTFFHAIAAEDAHERPS